MAQISDFRHANSRNVLKAKITFPSAMFVTSHTKLLNIYKEKGE
jgi:hypothetical protein